MERKHVVVILGSGLTVFGLAALSGFLIFSPSSIIDQPWFGLQNADTSNNNYQNPHTQSLPPSNDSLDNFSVQEDIAQTNAISTPPPPEMKNKENNKSSWSALDNFSLGYNIAPAEKISKPIKIQDENLKRSSSSLEEFSLGYNIAPVEKISKPIKIQDENLKRSSSSLEEFSLGYNIAPAEKISKPIKIQNEDLKRSSSIKNIPEVSYNFTYQSNTKEKNNTKTTTLNSNNVGLLSPKRSLKTTLYSKKADENKQQSLTKNVAHSAAPQHNADYSHTDLRNIPRTNSLTPIGSSYYWIQVGSYSSLGRAKKSQKLLKDLGVSGNIEIYHLDNKYVYRLKVGAWRSKEEALNFVQHFKEFYPIFSNDAFVVG